MIQIVYIDRDPANNNCSGRHTLQRLPGHVWASLLNWVWQCLPGGLLARTKHRPEAHSGGISFLLGDDLAWRNQRGRASRDGKGPALSYPRMWGAPPTETPRCWPPVEKEEGVEEGPGRAGLASFRPRFLHLRPQPAGYRLLRRLSSSYVTPERGSWASKGGGERRGRRTEERRGRGRGLAVGSTPLAGT